ncbi:DUF4328 domain-containing protein [Kitasatospora sp. NPDC094015]|uniref:DUF4328 domain-containing protein n=1 Tax=Kitasatospora sp. NPDC094015 TaxID=3155205 RepID=UPI003325A4D7
MWRTLPRANLRGDLRVKPSSKVPSACDPRLLATGTQVLLFAQAVEQAVLGVTDGSGSQVYMATGMWTMPLFLGTVVVFLGWFRRCRLNAELFAPKTHTYAPGRALGVWFVPVVMWWAPRRAVLDIARASRPDGSTWLVNAWWAAWIAKSVAIPLYMAVDLEGSPNQPWIAAVQVLACILAIAMVQQVTAGQSSRIGRTGRQAAPAV